jgi:hypothetical protein
LSFFSARLICINQVATVGLIALVPGGIMSLGSDVATLQQTIAATSAVEVLRSDLIGRIHLRAVGEMKLVSARAKSCRMSLYVAD